MSQKNLRVKIKVGDVAPNFQVEMLDGTILKLNELKGKVVLLNFWATWCAPCIMEFYDIPAKIIEPFGNKDFVLIPVSIGEKKYRVQKKMEQLRGKGVDFNVGIDPDEVIWNLYDTGPYQRILLLTKMVTYTL